MRRKEQLRQEVRKIMQKLHGEGKYPTIKQVRILLGYGNEWAEVSAAVAASRKEFSELAQTFCRWTQNQADTQPCRTDADPDIGTSEWLTRSRPEPPLI